MIGALILILFLYFISQPILSGFKARLSWFDLPMMQKLFWYHMFFAGVYYVFALNAPSDSVAYFHRPQENYESWFSAYKTGTPFIDFLGYPLINFLGFSYEMMMALFAWLGYWGFVYFYIFFKENIRFKHTFQGIDLITLFIFLPNMHYWTSSLGKGSTIFLGLAMAIYGLSKIEKRKLALIFGLLIVYHVRPHVFLFMAVGIVVGLFTGKQNVPFYQKFLVFAGSVASLFLMYDDIMAFTGLDGDNLLESFDQFSTTRSGELAKANSGIDISNYPLILKLLTFWFRPLFFDAPGPVGIIVSFENLLYVILALKLFQKGFIKYLRKSPALVKTSAVVFLATSFALSGTLSNLGIIIRQKSMVMYFFLFVILCFLDYKKGLAAIKKRKLREQQNRMLNLNMIKEA